MTFLVELTFSPDGRMPCLMVFDHADCGTTHQPFRAEGPEGSGAFSGFFASPDDALTDAKRVIGSDFAYTTKRDGDLSFYDISLS